MKRFIFALALASAFAFGGPNLAFATMEGHEASRVDPYLNCPLTPDFFGGVNYPNTEPEPWLAHNPAHPDNFVGTFQQDRWSDGGARGLTAAYSFNDGHLWNNVALPFSKCAVPYYGPAPCPFTGIGSPTPCTMLYDRASDPWNDFGVDGIGYTVSISFNANDNNNAVGAAVTLDGGATWTRGTEIIHDIDADPQFPFNDKEAVTADPVVPQSAYVVWDRLALIPCGPAAVKGNAPKDDDRHWKGKNRVSAAPPKSADVTAQQICFEGPTYFSRTTNGGLTWSTPTPIVPGVADEQTIANQIVVDPTTGRLYNFYVYFPNVPPFTPELRMVFSNDKGLTWSSQQFINTLETVGIHDPQVPDNFARTGDIVPVPAIDPATGQLYLVWQDGRFNANSEDDVLFSTSVAGGLTGTWTAPQKVNLPVDRAGFTPGVKVNAMGQLGIDYYSLRHPDLGPDVWPIERYIRISNGPAVVSTTSSGLVASIGFNTPTRDAGPFNMLMAPFAGGFFTGDYEGMAIDRDGKSFHTFFTTQNCDTTNCPAVGYPAPSGTVTATGAGTSSPPDPMDVYSNQYYKGGS